MSAPEHRADNSPAPADLIAIIGATGTGKSDLAIAVAEAYRSHGRRAEIVNADAMQLYRGMNIGTAKVPEEARHGIPHHQLDVLDVVDDASVAAYQREARATITQIGARGGVAILTGGSGLYVSAVLFDLRFPGRDPGLRAALEQELAAAGPAALLERLRTLDPAAAATIDANNSRRLIRAVEIATRTGRVTTSLPTKLAPWRPSRVLRLHRDRPTLVAALAERAKRMFADGLLDEVDGLRAEGLEHGTTARAAIGYAQALQVLNGTMTRDAAIESTSVATRQYARRQVSWFKRYEDVDDFDLTNVTTDDLVPLAHRIVL